MRKYTFFSNGFCSGISYLLTYSLSLFDDFASNAAGVYDNTL